MAAVGPASGSTSAAVDEDGDAEAELAAIVRKCRARGPTFAQVVVGPPGAGKTTYCNGMQQFMQALGRKCVVVNLDPANDGVPFDVAVDVMDLVSLQDVMEELGLGPNGGLIYCMEFLEENVDWLLQQLLDLDDAYVLFDCPGQVELFTHHESFTSILTTLTKADFRLTAVHLVDAQHCRDSGHYISMALTSLATMMRLELPHINVLSKIDLFHRFGLPPFSLDTYTQASDLELLADMVGRRPADAEGPDFDARFEREMAGGDDDREAGEGDGGDGDDGDDRERGGVGFMHRFRRLNQAIVEVLEDYSMVGFRALDIQDKDSVASLVKVIDKSNGYAVGYLGEPAKALDSMPEFGEWNDDIAMAKVMDSAPLPSHLAADVVTEEAAEPFKPPPSAPAAT